VELELRTFRVSDEPQLIPLWNRVHAGYGGFIARTAEHWRWSVRQLRGIPDADILIGESAGIVRSYGALASEGTVVEFAVDTQLTRRDRKRACAQLIEGLERRARAKGCASITFVAAASDSLIDDVLRDAGFVAEQGAYFSLGLLNPAMMIERILAHPAHRLPADWNRRVLLDLSSGDFPEAIQSHLLLTIAAGQVAVHDMTHESSQGADWRFRLDYQALAELIFHTVTFDEAVASQRLVIESGCSPVDAATFFGALRLNAPWYTPPSDAF
jgi:hypothetical protein